MMRWKWARLIVFVSAAALTLPGCIALKGAGAVAKTGVKATGKVVKTGAKATGKAVKTVAP